MNKLVSLKNKLGNPAKNKKGFTLVEMIIVMVIMAILAAALIPTMMGFVKDAKNNAHLATARAYYVAAQSVATYTTGTGGTIDADTFTDTNDKWKTMTDGLEGDATVKMDGDKVDYITYNSGVAGTTSVKIEAGGAVTFGKVPAAT